MKKAQITIFIILGIVIVAAIGFFVAYKSSLTAEKAVEVKGIATLSPELKEAGETIEGCIKGVASDGVTKLGLHGGYVDNSNVETFDYGGLPVTYLYSDKKSSLPTKEQMASGLSAYVKANAKECILAVRDFEVTPAAIRAVTSTINNDNIDLVVEWPISIKKDAVESKVDGFKIRLPVRLGLIHNEITGFMTVQQQNPDTICISCLIDSSQRNKFAIEVNNYITTYVFVVKDKASATSVEQPYSFIFANGY